MYKYLIFFLFLTACSTYSTGPNNRNDEQDLSCYTTYKGDLGYCDCPRHQMNCNPIRGELK